MWAGQAGLWRWRCTKWNMKKRLLNDYGMLLALLVLCLLFSGLTYTEQHPTARRQRVRLFVLAERDLASGANVSCWT